MNVNDNGLEMLIADMQPLLQIDEDPSFTLCWTGYFNGGISCSTGNFSNLYSSNTTCSSAFFSGLSANSITGVNNFLTSINATNITGSICVS